MLVNAFIAETFYMICWTYTQHCSIADMNPSKRWNGEFREFRICIGWISTTIFFVWVFMCSTNFSLFFWFSFPATTPRATTPYRSLFRLPRRGLQRPYRCIQANRLPRLQGYHTRATTLQTNFWVVTGRRMDCRVTTVEELLSSTGPNSS